MNIFFWNHSCNRLSVTRGGIFHNKIQCSSPISGQHTKTPTMAGWIILNQFYRRDHWFLIWKIPITIPRYSKRAIRCENPAQANNNWLSNYWRSSDSLDNFFSLIILNFQRDTNGVSYNGIIHLVWPAGTRHFSSMKNAVKQPKTNVKLLNKFVIYGQSMP